MESRSLLGLAAPNFGVRRANDDDDTNAGTLCSSIYGQTVANGANLFNLEVLVVLPIFNHTNPDLPKCLSVSSVAPIFTLKRFKNLSDTKSNQAMGVLFIIVGRASNDASVWVWRNARRRRSKVPLSWIRSVRTICVEIRLVQTE